MAMDPLVVGRVISDVLDPFTKSVSLKVSYSGNRAINNGTDLRPSQVANQPRVEVGGDDLRTFYTLVSIICIYIYIYVCVCVCIYILFSLYIY